MVSKAVSVYRYLTSDVRAQIEALFPHYPERRAVLLPALWIIQNTHGFIPLEAQRELAQFLDLPVVWVHEVVSFYTMFHTEPVGRYVISVCCNISCSLRGARHLLQRLLERLGIREGETTADGLFTVERVQCIGACEVAPVIQVNGEFIGPVDETRLEDLIHQLRRSTEEAQR